MRRIELSHAVADGTVTYPGLPAASICDFWTREQSRGFYADGETSCHIARVDMVGNTGTYIDAPFHFYEDGEDVAALDLARCVDLPGLRISTSAQTIGPEAFAGLELAGRAVLLHTGWDRHFGDEAYGGAHPHLSEAAAQALVAAGAALVGIDSVNIDDKHGPGRPVHSTLLGAGVPIVEHLTGLDGLPDAGFRFSAAPARLRGVGSFPVRAYAILEER